ncbi:molecular chaperone [Enterobacteriaceae bacterium 89]|nr:molecular chaperone [Enterobacteriaceae bacterium 89]
MEYVMSLMIKLVAALSFTSFSVLASGGVYLDATRIIYNETDTAKSVKVVNSSKELPYLLRTWISNDKNEKSNGWVVTPPIYRLNASNAIQLKLTSGNRELLPQDRESVVFLNVLSIPGDPGGKGSENSTDLSGKITVALNTRIKVFYRPQKVADKSSDKAFEQLKIKNVGNKLLVDNPTPFHINFSEFKINGVSQKFESQMISPFAQLELATSEKELTVSYRIINDFGGEVSASKKIM